MAKKEGGGQVDAYWSGSNFDPEAGLIDVFMSVSMHEANIEVLAVRDLPDDSSGTELSPGTFYAGEEVAVDVRVLDDWGDPVSTTVFAEGGSYDPSVVNPQSAGTNGAGEATMVVELLTPGDAGFTLTTTKGGTREVPLVAARDALVVVDSNLTIDAKAGKRITQTIVKTVSGHVVPGFTVTPVSGPFGRVVGDDEFTFTNLATTGTGRLLKVRWNGGIGNAVLARDVGTYTFKITPDDPNNYAPVQFKVKIP